ncbi:peptidoglycan-binding domain-containing protein [Bradyrhizobium sp. 6(2017)]|uniref:peptidoglycan-binding domain-containing protein n=1 Tax=Bradyrhizobium sp. 6(2017) TaxID=1197460 RepID=UPI0013E146D5|nr:hypothetical protein [Bradyrhizobium sp. 6(2017)]QIG96808.1 hypothetical protein G6P99_33325 [Bradyrhizobium sp. 6(2017)]
MARFNVAIAIRFTPYYAKSAGWGDDVAKVCNVLGFKHHYPDPKEFVTAVHDWQRKHPPLVPDGMLGPITWSKLGLVVAAYQDSTRFMGSNPEWIAKASANSNKAPAKPPAQLVMPVAVKADEDKLIDEMVKVIGRQKNDPYLPVAVSGAYALDQTRRGVKSNGTGQPISQTLQVGQQWQGIAGPRIIVGLTGSGTFGDVIFVTNSGQIYSQTVIGWESDMFAKLYSDVSRNLEPIKTLLDAEAAFLLGMCAATSAAAAGLVFVGSVTQWMLKNKDNMPKYIYSIDRLLDIRSRMKVIAPTLSSEVVDVAVKRIFAEIPDSLSKDPIVIARFAGGMVMKLGVVIYTRNFTSLVKWLGMLSEVIFAGVRSVPGAIKAAVSDKDLVEKLKAIGADITLDEAFVIKEEVTRNEAELKRIFDKIEGLVGLFR